jgi:hypothetical protein
VGGGGGVVGFGVGGGGGEECEIGVLVLHWGHGGEEGRGWRRLTGVNCPFHHSTTVSK